MWGREMRAGLVFVIAALLIGQGFRDWKRSHETYLRDIVRELETQDALSRAASPPPDSMPARGAGIRRPLPREAPVGRIDVNRASASELVRLPGIGPSLAGRILADRDQHGGFPSPEALLRVRGIGPKTLERIRGFLSFPTPSGGDSLTGF